ncbi:MAG: PDZ domain-containing protein [Akkermansiaceae bacterium]|nr:PDZ domain-containing protein [Akkermansiaceae bacterium]
MTSSILLVLGLSAPAWGIERPKSLDDDARRDRDAAPRAVEVEPGEEEIPRAVPAEEKPAAWLGVFSEPVDATLATHLGIEGGVVLRYVAEGSPAAAAGLKTHDVVTSVDGMPVRGQESLRDAILARAPGDELKVGVVSGGQKAQRDVKLTARPANLPNLPPRRLHRPDAGPQAGGERLPEMRERLRELEKLFPDGAGDLQRQLQAQMEKMEEHLDRMEQMPELGLNLDLKEMLEDLPKGGNNFNFNLKMAGSMKLMDEQGSVEMKMRDGGKEVAVRDKEGNLVYEGPWDTEQDKAAVDPDLRERIERLNFNGGGGALRFHLENHLDPLGEPGEAEPGAAEKDPD